MKTTILMVIGLSLAPIAYSQTDERQSTLNKFDEVKASVQPAITPNPGLTVALNASATPTPTVSATTTTSTPASAGPTIASTPVLTLPSAQSKEAEVVAENTDLRDDPDYRREAKAIEDRFPRGMTDTRARMNFLLMPKLIRILESKGLLIGGKLRITPATIKLCVDLPGTKGAIPLGPEEDSYRFPGMAVLDGIPFDLVQAERMRNHWPPQRGLRRPHRGVELSYARPTRGYRGY